MNPVRKWIEALIRISRDQAEYSELNQRVQQGLYIFAIEIGLRRKLTPKERVRYEKTFATAEALVAINEKCPPNPDKRFFINRLMSDCVANWPKHEPHLKGLLERLMQCRFDDLDAPPGMWPEMREMIAEQIRAVSRVCPDQLPASEIAEILDRLEHPLDRA